MNIYKLTVQYKGTSYSGFQVQAEGRTIQGELNKALQILSQTEQVKSLGSGRTDAGVHALAQVVKVEIPVHIPEGQMARAMNSHLPPDIRVIAAESVGPDFHPIYSAHSKEYNYVFTTEPLVSPLVGDLVTSFPFDLDIPLMQKGCALFCGEHDFINYQCTGTDVESTVRTIKRCELLHFTSSGHWAHLLENYYVLRVEGNGFLKQMVRLLMGALINLGKGKVSLLDVETSLQKPLKNRLGPTAPPQGLYLKQVHY